MQRRTIACLNITCVPMMSLVFQVWRELTHTFSVTYQKAFYLRHILIAYSHLLPGLLSFELFWLKYVWFYRASCVLHVPLISYFYSTVIFGWAYNLWSYSLQFSLSSCCFVSHVSKYSPWHLVHKYPSSTFFSLGTVSTALDKFFAIFDLPAYSFHSGLFGLTLSLRQSTVDVFDVQYEGVFKNFWTESITKYTLITAPGGRELCHLQFLLEAASPKTFGYTLVWFSNRLTDFRLPDNPPWIHTCPLLTCVMTYVDRGLQKLASSCCSLWVVWSELKAAEWHFAWLIKWRLDF